MGAKLLTEHHFEFLSFKGGCTGSSEPTLMEMQHCWKSLAVAYMCNQSNVSGSYHIICLVINTALFVCLFDLIIYVPVNNFSVMSGWVFLG